MAPHDRLQGTVNARPDGSRFRARKGRSTVALGIDHPISWRRTARAKWSTGAQIVAYSRREITPNHAAASRRRERRLMPIPRQVQIRRPKDFCGHLSDSDADDRNDNELLIRWAHRYSTVRSNHRVGRPSSPRGGGARLSCHPNVYLPSVSLVSVNVQIAPSPRGASARQRLPLRQSNPGS